MGISQLALQSLTKRGSPHCSDSLILNTVSSPHPLMPIVWFNYYPLPSSCQHGMLRDQHIQCNVCLEGLTSPASKPDSQRERPMKPIVEKVIISVPCNYTL